MSVWRKGINDAATASPDPHAQILELRRLVRDLIALSALPAMWKDYEPSRVADSAASALARRSTPISSMSDFRASALPLKS
jgi:hypothetical protein